MLNCKQFQDAIFDNLDGLTDSETRKEVERHIQGCSECLQFFQGAQTIKQSLHHLPQAKTSADFETILRSRISLERSLSRKGVLSWPLRGPAYAFAGATALIVALLYFSSNDALTQRQPQAIPNAYSAYPSQSQIPKTNYQAFTQQSRKVNYPMDVLDLPRHGTALESRNSPQSTYPDTDSLRKVRYENVNWEF